jgi:NSS family neurotransmitter:Na+ symporter
MTEFMLGRMGRQSPIKSLRTLARQARARPAWQALGGLCVLIGFLMLTYYCVIGGWFLAYATRAAAGALQNLTVDGAGVLFSAFVRDAEKQLFWHALFLAMTLLVVGRGLHRGLEAVARYLTPMLFCLLIVLLGYAGYSGQFVKAVEHLLYPDFVQLSAEGVLVALGDAFFTFGLGMGAMLMYGAHAREETRIVQIAIAVAVMDTLAGLMAAVAIYAILFAGGVSALPGAALAFQALPAALEHLPLGRLILIFFFALLVMAVWLRAIGLVEPVLTWLEERFNLSRRRAVLWCGLCVWALGVVTILSFEAWAFSFSLFGDGRALGFFDILQILTGHVMVVVAALLLAWFAGWRVHAWTSRAALRLRSPCSFDVWVWLNRVIIPALLVVLLYSMPLFL